MFFFASVNVVLLLGNVDIQWASSFIMKVTKIGQRDVLYQDQKLKEDA